MKRLPDATLLAARIVIGVTYVAYGLSLLEDPSISTGTFTGMGVPFPGVVMSVAAAVGLIGGLCFAAGFALPASGIALALLTLLALVPADGAGAIYASVRVPPPYVLMTAFACLGIGFNGGRFTLARYRSERRVGSTGGVGTRG